jgi:hypothetical protein
MFNQTKGGEMKHIWEIYLQPNMVDVLLWAVALFMAIRYGVMQWRKPEARGWLFVLFLCFYGAVLVYRLGNVNWVLAELIERCQAAGIDLSDILP